MNKVYLDGLLEFGLMNLKEDIEGYLTIREFETVGTLFYRLETIKEQDLLKFDTKEVTIKMKISSMLHKDLKSFHIIKLDTLYYEIEHIETNVKNSEYSIFLKEYDNSLDTVIEILEDIKESKFDSSNYIVRNKILANVKKLNLTFENLADKKDLTPKYTVIVKDMKLISDFEKNDLLNRLRIGFENNRLMINHINIKSVENGLYELLCEGV